MTKPQKNTPPYSLLVLAGGEGRRLGGRDKGLVDWQGKPLVSYSVDILGKCAAEILISCNRNLDAYRQFGKITQDESSEFLGPLAGLLSGLKAAKENWVLICPCDCPTPPKHLADALFTAGADTPPPLPYAPPLRSPILRLDEWPFFCSI